MKTVALNYIYLSKIHAGGKDQVGLNLLKGFQELGVAKNMYVICYEYSVEKIKAISRDIHIISLKAPNQKTELNRKIGDMFTNTFKIPNILRRYGIDVIYHLDCNNGLRKFKVRSIEIPHDIKAIAHRNLPGLHIPFYKYWFYKIMYAIDFMHADTIIGISDVDKLELQKYYPKYKEKIIRMYNPIDIPLCTEFITKRESNIVAINIQFHHKNIITLIKAFEKIKDEISENLILIGNLPHRVQYLKEYVIKHNLEDRVHFTGFVSDNKRNHILQYCRLYVAPTLFEGFGMVSVEAIISGVPTLVSKIPTNYEITKGLCNYYEPAEDADALACKLKKILNESPKEQEIIHNAKQLEACYNYKIISRQYWDLFNRIEAINEEEKVDNG